MAPQGNSQRPLLYPGASFKCFSLTRKTVLILLAICVLFAYFGPHYLLRVFRFFSQDVSVDDCMKTYLKKHDPSVSKLDAYVKPWSKQVSGDEPVPFVGNGKIAAVVNPDSRLHIIYTSSVGDDTSVTVSHGEPRSFELPFKPVLKPEANFASGRSISTYQVINFREGIVETLSCIKLADVSKVLFVNHTVVAHRSHPNVFLQHTEAFYDGHSSEKIAIPMKHGEVNSNLWKEEKDATDIILRSGTFKVTEAEHIAVSIVSRISGNILKIGEDGRGSVDAVHVVTHSKPKSSRILARNEEAKVKNEATLQASLIKNIPADQLLQEHKKSWEDILHTGLTISTSGENSGLPSPLVINETLYYVLSCSESNLHNENIPAEERRNLVQRLQTPEFCYHGNPTFHGDSLWRRVTSVQGALELQRRWTLTLRKNQCKSLVSEGAEGILQAMLLSFGGLRFTESDLRLNMDPFVLHNNIAFHRLIYRNDTISISIKRGTGEQSPVISVALEEVARIKLYACEAGCIHDPVELGKKPEVLPVFVTDPVTAILYISHDRAHLRDLRDTIHVKARIDHAHHMEVFGKTKGLPTLFWIGIGSLVVFFHLFLIQLICREYHSSKSTSYSGRNTKYTWYSTRERNNS